MTIESLPPERWREYRALRLEALQNEPLAFGSKYEDMVGRPDSYWIRRLQDAAADPARAMSFAFGGGACVGMAAIFPTEEPPAINLISMYVTPGARRRGIGRILVSDLIERVRALGTFSEIRLTVGSTQVAAVALYESLGFRAVSQENLRRGDGSEYIELTMVSRSLMPDYAARAGSTPPHP